MMTAIYRESMQDPLLEAMPLDVIAAARETLAGATNMTARLPVDTGQELLLFARDAFTDGMQLAMVVAAAIALAGAILARVMFAGKER